MIELILDTMLPGDPELGLPPASTLDIEGYQLRYGVAQVFEQFVAVLERVANEKFGCPFEALDEAQRLAAINACKLADIRLFSAFLTHTLRAYYTDRRVLGCLSNDAVPPFPAGNPLGADDWSILEPVYERGPIYREVDAA